MKAQAEAKEGKEGMIVMTVAMTGEAEVTAEAVAAVETEGTNVLRGCEFVKRFFTPGNWRNKILTVEIIFTFPHFQIFKLL